MNVVPPGQGRAAARLPRVLVAEPSRTLSALIRASLGELSAELEIVADGAAALASARAKLPDLLICDAGLPGLDGYALAHSMKQLAGQKRLPVLLLVPDFAIPDPERLSYVGITDVLMKPFERAVLLERVRGLLTIPDRRPAALPHYPDEAPREEPQARPAERAYAERSERAAPSFADRTPSRITERVEVEPRADKVDELVQRALAKSLDASVERALERALDRPGEGAIERMIEARLGSLVTQRLPTLVDGALARLLPTVIHEAAQRALGDRVPLAVEGAVRAALSELATPTRIDNIVAEEVRGVLAATVSAEVARASDEIRVRVETELLSRLDHFARTELRDRLTAHAEQIVWKVVPTLAEDLVKDEIKRLTAD